MIIGILTFYRVVNFGANLQALSTYRYLEAHGHTPIMINYQSAEMQKTISKCLQRDKQAEAHLKFVNEHLINQTKLCSTFEEVCDELERMGIERIIIGSDAVLQHHPLLSRIHIGRRKPFYILKLSPERRYPNIFWGEKIIENVSCSLMSVSSQNSRYNLFSPSLKKKMKESLSHFTYISVRDKWTQKMLYSITGDYFPITPDPVFAFNQNVADLIPSRESILKKFNIPDKYVLISLRSQSISREKLLDLKNCFKKHGIDCVTLPMPTGHGYQHDFSYQIPEPLDPLDWYALIKYSSGYIGSNMHPIIVSLHNGVPCYSIDNWGSINFFNRRRNDGSSKVEDIMKEFDLDDNHQFINGQECIISPITVVKAILSFPKEKVVKKSQLMYTTYTKMMNSLIESFDN